MKRRDLVRHIVEQGGRSVRDRGGHEIFQGPTGARAPLKHSREIPWVIAQGVCKQLGIDPPAAAR